MQNPIKGTNWLEKIGLVLLILSVVFMLIHPYLEIGQLTTIMEQHQLFFWLGLAIWALGYLIRENANKES